MNNPMNFLKMMLGKQNPQQMIMNMIGNNNPMMNNLVKMAQNGNKQGVEQFARNVCKEKGIDFDKNFSEFMSNFK